MEAEVDLTMNQKIMMEEIDDHTEVEIVDMEEKCIINIIFEVMNIIDMTIMIVSAGKKIIISLQMKSNSSKEMERTTLY